MKIGFLSMGKSFAQYGLNLVVEAAKARGYAIEQASPGISLADYDVLLVSLYWWEHVYDWIRVLGESGINPADRHPIIIAGGLNASLNPLPFLPYVHYIVGGDGEANICDILESIDKGKEPCCDGVSWDGKGEPTKAAIAESLVYCPYLQASNLERLTHSDQKSIPTIKPITYVEIARGCPHRCRFCALSHLKPYRELDWPTIQRAIRKSRTKAICLFSPERSVHPAWELIRDECDRMRHTDTSSDIRVEKLLKIDKIGKIQFGLEGLSERLRKAIAKALPTEKFLDLMQRAAELPSLRQPHHRTVHAYLIAGLPGECQADYDEWADTLELLNDRLPHDFVFRMTINWFIPQPFTPMQFAHVHTRSPKRQR